MNKHKLVIIPKPENITFLVLWHHDMEIIWVLLRS